MCVVDKQFVSRIFLQRDKIESFDEYPFNIPIVRNLKSFDLHSKVNFFVGENGTGKSTLIEAIAIAMGFNPEGGSKNFNFSTNESQANLHQFLRISKGYRRPRDGFFLRAESFFNVATEIDNLEDAAATVPYGGKSLHKQSHGESFIALLQNRFFGNGLYILDEPEAALSPQRQLTALALIHQLVENNSQFIIATHSPILMSYPNAIIFSCDQGSITPIAYEETEHYKITRDFIMHPQRMLDELLK